MNLRAISPSSGLPDRFQVPWERFVQVVLEIVVEAYREMREDGVARPDWVEDTFNVVLATKYIEPLARRHPLSLVAIPLTKVHTEAILRGDEPPRRAKEIDIRLCQWTGYREVYFAWECKRVGDKRLDGQYARLVSEYITEGILRFINGDYASGLDDAGMLGYVLAGAVINIADDINQSMLCSRRARPLREADQLVPAPAIDGFADVYRSRHERARSHSIIRLHHLFLTFVFDQSHTTG